MWIGKKKQHFGGSVNGVGRGVSVLDSGADPAAEQST